MMWRVLFLALVPLAAGIAVPADGNPLADYVLPDPNALTLKVDVLEPHPLPFQAIRLRVRLSNTGEKDVGPLYPVDSNLGVLLKGPGQEEFRPIADTHQSSVNPGFSGTTARGQMNDSMRLILHPGFETSVSFSFAADWGRGRDAVKPIIGVPGSYVVKCYYSGVKRPYLEQVGQIKVLEPSGADKTVFEMLSLNKSLAAALMSPRLVPEKELVEELSRIVERHSESSYAAYAKFALARALLFGKYDHPSLAGEARDGKALSLLQEASLDRFPYHTHVLVALRDHLRKHDATAKTIDLLNREHPDAMEWLEEAAKSQRQNVMDLIEKRRKDLRDIIFNDPPLPEAVLKPLTREFSEINSKENISKLCAVKWTPFRVRQVR